jgi:hypothetical protein
VIRGPIFFIEAEGVIDGSLLSLRQIRLITPYELLNLFSGV